MREIKNELRMVICMKLLLWCMRTAPKNKEGFELINAIQSYLKTALKQIEVYE